MDHPISGVITALVTPFTESGVVDHDALRRLVRRQVADGVTGIAAAASTGEGVALDGDEHREVVGTVVDEADAAGRDMLVAAGISVSGTDAACRLAEGARAAGADAILVSAPPYNKPPQRGLLRHFRAVAEAAALPVILYNVPSRTGGGVAAETVLELASEKPFVGVKEASGDLGQVSRIVANRPADFAVLSGDDLLTLPIVSLRGDGVIAVVSNQVPGALVELVEAARAGHRERAAELHARLLPLMEANFVESNPIPVKWSLAEAGLLEDRLRDPLTSLSPDHARTMRAAMEDVADLFPGAEGA